MGLLGAESCPAVVSGHMQICWHRISLGSCAVELPSGSGGIPGQCKPCHAGQIIHQLSTITFRNSPPSIQLQHQRGGLCEDIITPPLNTPPHILE